MFTSKKTILFFLIIISLIPLLSFLKPGLPATHDGQDHVARIANFYASLKEGNIVPRWAGNLNWGYGHPILMFLYPLPSYSAALFHFLGLTFVNSVKAVFILAFIASGVTMYLWTESFLGVFPALISAVLYLFAPYRFVDMYVRGALGEHVAFIFPPLILFFMFRFAKELKFKEAIFGAIALSLLILAHNAISLMFMPFFILYAGYLLWQTNVKKKLFLGFSYIFVFGFFLSAFFWLPALFEGKYTLRDIVIKDAYLSRFVSIKSFLYGFWNYGISGQFSVQLGILAILALLLSFIFIVKADKTKLALYLINLVYFLFAIFLMLRQSNFIWQRISLLRDFQFPWRLLSVTTFSLALTGGFLFYAIPKKLKVFIGIIFIFFTIFSVKNYWQAKAYLIKPESFYSGIYKSTTDTGESSPIWSVRFMEQEPKAHIETISGQAKIEEEKRLSTLHSYRLTVLSNKAGFRENTLYFPGWFVYVDNNRVPIQFQDPNSRGLITFFVPEGTHSIMVKFEETSLRKIANFISFASFLVTLLFIFKIFNLRSKDSR